MPSNAELTAAVCAALEDPNFRNKRTFALSINQQPFWVKQALGQDPAGVRMWQRIGGKGPFGVQPLPKTLSQRLDQEAYRLDDLKEKGEVVPAIFARAEHWLLLEDVGISLRLELPAWSKEKRIRVLTEQATALAQFHNRGCWHGGPQLKNLAIKGEQITRFDFEEAFSEAASLVAIQARDLYLYLHSCADWFGDFEGLGKPLVYAYTEACQNKQIVHMARQAMLRTRFWRALACPFLGLMGRDVRRLCSTASLLEPQ